MVDPGDSLSGARVAPYGKLIVALALIGVAGAAWWKFGRGKGEPEDPARVLIIGPSPELVDFLDRRGFDPEHLSYGAAVGEGQAYDASLDDVAAIVEFADQRGFGYVALDLAHGHDYDFAGAGYEVDAIPSGSTFAVLALGQIGDSVSFGGVVEGVHHEPPADEQVGLLLALFGQPMLAKARTGDAINDLMIRFGSGRTLDDLAAYEKAQTTMRHQIAAWQALPERERGEPRPTELARPYERVLAWPLAGGQVLLGSARAAWHSPDGLRSEWSDTGASADLSWIRLDAPSERSPCSALPDTLALDEGFRLGPAGDALLVPSDRWVAQLWVLGDEGCGFEARGPIRRLAGGELGKPRAAGRTAEALEGAILWADAKMEAYRTLRIGGVTTRAGTLAWLDDAVVVVPVTIDYASAATIRQARMALAADPAADLAALPVLDPASSPASRDALLLVRLPAAKPAQGEASERVEVALLPAEPGVALLEVTPIAGEAVIVRRQTADGDELARVELAGAGRDLAWADVLAPAYELASAPASFVPLASLPAEIDEIAISPKGTHVAWTAEFEPARGHELVVLEFGSTPQRRTENDDQDLRPRFAGPSSTWLVFETTRVAAEDLPAITTTRAIPVDRG